MVNLIINKIGTKTQNTTFMLNEPKTIFAFISVLKLGSLIICIGHVENHWLN